MKSIYNHKKEFYPINKEFKDTLVQRAKNLRIEQTISEKIIWNAVKNKQLGVKFRRQFIISHYIVDFICLEKKLIVEIDGISHIGNEKYDNKREIELKEMGYQIIRFTDEEVAGNGNMVVNKLKSKLSEL